MIYHSFTAFLDRVLRELGFQSKRGAYWYRRDPTGLIVVNLQKSSFGPGVYVNYGLCFSKKKQPKEFECEVFGRNPALSPKEFSRFQARLDEVAKVCRNPRVQLEVRRVVTKQINCLAQWQNVENLRRRLLREQPLEMIVDRSMLEI